MELLYLIPGDGMPKDELKRREDAGNSIIRPGSTFHTEEVGEGPLSIESSIEEFMSIGPMLERLLQIRKEDKYDAIIIGCAGDPGLVAAREMMDLPIIGPAESSYHLTCMIADRFSVLTPLQAGIESEDRVRVRIREMGLEISVDDFGTGYSSLSYLKSLPLDELKIDGTFVSGVPGDADDVAIVTAIIGLAHSLGLRVVAECVETEEQLAFLEEQGCDEYQGFLFSKPVAPDQWAELIRRCASQ